MSVTLPKDIIHQRREVQARVKGSLCGLLFVFHCILGFLSQTLSPCFMFWQPHRFFPQNMDEFVMDGEAVMESFPLFLLPFRPSFFSGMSLSISLSSQREETRLVVKPRQTGSVSSERFMPEDAPNLFHLIKCLSSRGALIDS